MLAGRTVRVRIGADASDDPSAGATFRNKFGMTLPNCRHPGPDPGSRFFPVTKAAGPRLGGRGDGGASRLRSKQTDFGMRQLSSRPQSRHAGLDPASIDSAPTGIAQGSPPATRMDAGSGPGMTKLKPVMRLAMTVSAPPAARGPRPIWRADRRSAPAAGRARRRSSPRRGRRGRPGCWTRGAATSRRGC
jgi:hypothetical protein